MRARAARSAAAWVRQDDRREHRRCGWCSRVCRPAAPTRCRPAVGTRARPSRCRTLTIARIFSVSSPFSPLLRLCIFSVSSVPSANSIATTRPNVGPNPACPSSRPPTSSFVSLSCAQEQPESLAGVALSARRDVGRRRRQLRAVLRTRDARRALPLRFARRGSRDADHSAAGADRHGLARIPARRPSGPAVRLSRSRPVCAARRAPVQSAQAADGSVREGRRPAPAPGTSRCSGSASIEDDTTFDDRDSAPYAPLAAVVDDAFTWGDDRPLRTPWHKTLIYELHVKGFTQLNPRVPEALRGTYLGLGVGGRRSGTSPRSASPRWS